MTTSMPRAVQELAGTSDSAGYGPPYNTAGTGLSVGPLAPQKWFGVTHPVDPARDFVITPLHSQQQPADVAAALKRWDTAGPDRQAAWATTFDTALTNADDDLNKVPAGDYGPVPTLAKGLTAMAVSGALDGVLMAQGGFYQTDFTKQILFLGDGSYLDDAATAAHLQGNTWGMMNETGNYPGQAWLWLYSFWYQIPQFNSDNPDDYLTSHADAIIFYIMAVLSLGLLLLPFIPGLKSIPRWIPLHRLIWRDYYRPQSTNTSGARFIKRRRREPVKREPEFLPKPIARPLSMPQYCSCRWLSRLAVRPPTVDPSRERMAVLCRGSND